MEEQTNPNPTENKTLGKIPSQNQIHDLVMKFGHIVSQNWDQIQHPADVIEKLYVAFSDVWQKEAGEKTRSVNSYFYDFARQENVNIA